MKSGDPSHLFVRRITERLRIRVARLLRGAAGRMLEWAHSPAHIGEFEYVEPLTNEIIYLSTGARYSVLHVGGKKSRDK
jgi:hypothetical protein